MRERSSVAGWYGEVSLRAEDHSEVGFESGVLGCGARLPNGHDGALEFEEGNF